MNDSVKKAVVPLLVVFVVVVAYYGNFLPMRKSQILIASLQNLGSVQSIEQFEKTISTSLDFHSPIGQEEGVRNIANRILELIQQSGDKLEVVREAVDFIESYYRPIIDRGRGMSFEQDLYLMGAINEIAFIKTKEMRFFSASKNYFEQGLKLGPKRPQFLYGLFDIYRIEGNVEAVKSIAAQISRQWPNDEKVKQGLQGFLEKVAATEKK